VADYLQVTTTVETREDADRIARGAVEARLAACAQVVGPIASTYWWEGAVQSATEFLILLKTAADRYGALADHLRGVHPYDEPEIIAVEVVAGSAGYLEWLSAETRPR
jgi:periplasmic divalent cation tolerance protein